MSQPISTFSPALLGEVPRRQAAKKTYGWLTPLILTIIAALTVTILGILGRYQVISAFASRSIYLPMTVVGGAIFVIASSTLIVLLKDELAQWIDIKKCCDEVTEIKDLPNGGKVIEIYTDVNCCGYFSRLRQPD